MCGTVGRRLLPIIYLQEVNHKAYKKPYVIFLIYWNFNRETLPFLVVILFFLSHKMVFWSYIFRKGSISFILGLLDFFHVILTAGLKKKLILEVLLFFVWVVRNNISGMVLLVWVCFWQTFSMEFCILNFMWRMIALKHDFYVFSRHMLMTFVFFC